VLSRPFIPDASVAMLGALGLEDADWPGAGWEAELAPGHAFAVPEVLFAKITDEAREAMAMRFAGA
jgi:methionyl-tRNA synthetase